MADQETASSEGARPAERTQARDLAWTSTAYFGEGLPFSFLHQLVTEYLTSIGAPRSVIGYTSWFHAPVTLKPLWAPWLDVGGVRRMTMLVLQVALGVGMLATSLLVDGSAEGPGAIAFWSALGALALVHAVHDIACDGFYIVALDDQRRALYSGTRIASYRAAMYVGSGALVILAGVTGSWTLAFAVCGAIMLAISLVNVTLVPRIAEPRTPRGESALHGFLGAFRTFFAQPSAVLVLIFVFTYRLGDVLTFAMSPPLLLELGMDDTARGLLRTLGLSASIVGSILAGWLLARGGLQRWFAPFTYVMVLPFYLLLAITRPGFGWIAVVVVVEQLAGALAGTALPVFLMQRTRKTFSASHYAFFSALVALMSTISGGFSGHLNEAVGNVWYFGLCFVASVPALVLVHVVPTGELEPTRASL